MPDRWRIAIEYKTNGRMVVGNNEVQRTWKYLEDLYMDTEEQVAIYMCSFGGVQEVIIFEESQLRGLKWKWE